MTNDSANAYLRTTVLTAKPEQLRLMLLEGAVKFARQGREGMATKHHEQAFIGLSRAGDIVVELMTTVAPDMDSTLRGRVMGLYSFIFKLLVDASFEKNLTKMDDAIKLLEYEVETWKLALEKVAQVRVGSSQPVQRAAAQNSRPALSVQG